MFTFASKTLVQVSKRSLDKRDKIVHEQPLPCPAAKSTTDHYLIDMLQVFFEENTFYLVLFVLFAFIYVHFKESHWQFVLALYAQLSGNEKPRTESLYFVAIYLWTTVLYWAYSGIFLLLEHGVKVQAWSKPYKIQPTKCVAWDKIRMASKAVAVNQLFVNLPVGFVFYRLALLRGASIYDPLPSGFTIVRDIAVFSLVVEFVFYYTHRFLHLRTIYPLFHKRHHEFTTPIGLAATYAHPLEHFLSNLLSVHLGPLLMGSHLVTCLFWFTIVILNTISNHSGYALPGMGSTRPHDFHHAYFNNCYGSIGLLDELHGTNRAFKRHVKSLVE